MTSSTSPYKHYFVCDTNTFREFCAAGLMGAVAGLVSKSKIVHPEDLRSAVKIAVDSAELMMDEFTCRRSRL